MQFRIEKVSVRIFLFCLFSTAGGKLVLDSLEDLFKADGEVDKDRIVAEALFLGTETRNEKAEECPDVDNILKVNSYEIWVRGEEGEFSTEVVEIASRTLVDFILPPVYIFDKERSWVGGNVTIRPIMNCFSADDSRVLDYVRSDILVPPSTQPYNFSTETTSVDGQFGQPIFLNNVIFKGQVTNGFFIEAGADDFLTDSNTLLFELNYGWSGILVEPHPGAYPLGLMRNRKAWAAKTCLGMETRPHTTHIQAETFEGGMAGIIPEEKLSKLPDQVFKVQCFPLYSLILATGNRTINYLSLDIEGADYQVLQTIPWDKVDIEVITIETVHAGKVFPGTKEMIREYLESLGYVMVATVEIDDVFVRKDLHEGKYKPDINEYEMFFEETEKFKREEL